MTTQSSNMEKVINQSTHSSLQPHPHSSTMNSRNETSASLGRLPRVLIQLIYQYLPISGLLRLARTSHYLQTNGMTELAWKSESHTTEREAMINLLRASGCDLRSTSRSSSRPFSPRIIQLHSHHTPHLLHDSLIRSHAVIEWDIHHDRPMVQAANCRAHGQRWTNEMVDQVNTANEFLVLSQLSSQLTSLTIQENSLTGQQLEELFQILARNRSSQLATLVLGFSREPHVQLTDSRLSDSAFLHLLTIASLTQLSLNSIDMNGDRLGLLSHLPALTSLSLIQHPRGLPRFVDDLTGLLSLGSLPVLRQLFISNFECLLEQFVQFLQQPQLSTKLHSFTIIQLSFYGPASSFLSRPSLSSRLREAFRGYIKLTELHLSLIANPAFYPALLLALSNLDDSQTPGLQARALLNFPTPIVTKEDTGSFLPNLDRLWFHDYSPFLRSGMQDFHQFFQHNSRPHLQILLNSYVNSMEDQLEEFSPLLTQYPQFSLHRMVPSPNSHIGRYPNPIANGADHYINILLYVGWLPNRGEAIGCNYQAKDEMQDESDQQQVQVDSVQFNSRPIELKYPFKQLTSTQPPTLPPSPLASPIHLLDTHIHLADEVAFPYATLSASIECAQRRNVIGGICVPMNLAECGRTLSRARLFPEFIYPAAGIHPVYYSLLTPTERRLEQAGFVTFLELHHSELICMGEIGLDYSGWILQQAADIGRTTQATQDSIKPTTPSTTTSSSSTTVPPTAANWKARFNPNEDAIQRQEQLDFFRFQLQLAKRYQLPLNIHSRNAAKHVVELLKSEGFGTTCQLPVLLHAFDGSVKTLKEAIKLGYFFTANTSLGRDSSMQTVLETVLKDSPRMTIQLPIRAIVKKDAPSSSTQLSSVESPSASLPSTTTSINIPSVLLQIVLETDAPALHPIKQPPPSASTSTSSTSSQVVCCPIENNQPSFLYVALIELHRLYVAAETTRALKSNSTGQPKSNSKPSTKSPLSASTSNPSPTASSIPTSHNPTSASSSSVPLNTLPTTLLTLSDLSTILFNNTLRLFPKLNSMGVMRTMLRNSI